MSMDCHHLYCHRCQQCRSVCQTATVATCRLTVKYCRWNSLVTLVVTLCTHVYYCITVYFFLWVPVQLYYYAIIMTGLVSSAGAPALGGPPVPGLAPLSPPISDLSICMSMWPVPAWLVHLIQSGWFMEMRDLLWDNTTVRLLDINSYLLFMITDLHNNLSHEWPIEKREEILTLRDQGGLRRAQTAGWVASTRAGVQTLSFTWSIKPDRSQWPMSSPIYMNFAYSS